MIIDVTSGDVARVSDTLVESGVLIETELVTKSVTCVELSPMSIVLGAAVTPSVFDDMANVLRVFESVDTVLISLVAEVSGELLLVMENNVVRAEASIEGSLVVVRLLVNTTEMLVGVKSIVVVRVEGFAIPSLVIGWFSREIVLADGVVMKSTMARVVNVVLWNEPAVLVIASRTGLVLETMIEADEDAVAGLPPNSGLDVVIDVVVTGSGTGSTVALAVVEPSLYVEVMIKPILVMVGEGLAEEASLVSTDAGTGFKEALVPLEDVVEIGRVLGTVARAVEFAVPMFVD